jgi:hypothetical protein
LRKLQSLVLSRSRVGPSTVKRSLTAIILTMAERRGIMGTDKPMFVAPRGLLEKKPAHGAPCNNCGLCCMATRCTLAMQVFALPRVGACPALVQTGKQEFACGLVLYAQTAEQRDAALLIIGSGDGCDARFNGEYRDEAFADALEAKYATAEMRAAVKQARKLWQHATTNGD